MTKVKTTSNLMLTVILACIPAVVTSTILFGTGVIYNILFASLSAIMIEFGCLKLRGKSKESITNSLLDYTALITALLFAMCLPPGFSIIKIFIGMVFAIAVAKHLYGGLGHNIFNPAMVGYIVLLIAFAKDFVTWPTPLDLFNLNIIDDLSMATPLDPIYNSLSTNKTEISIGSDGRFLNNFSYFNLINISWLIGGLYLYAKKIIPLSLPCGFLLGLFFTGLLNQNPIEHLFIGASMMGAFFIITDPVTAAVSTKGRWIYSILAGIFCMIIRLYGSYPDGVGFAVLFMNTWVPLINKLTIKQAYIK